MNSDSQLEQQIQKYRAEEARSTQRFLRGLAVALLILGAGTATIWYRTIRERAKNRQLEAEHKTLSHAWSLHKKSAQKLKLQKKVAALCEPTHLATYLGKISECIPPHSLLTSLTFKAPQSITIEGYAESGEELGSFMLNLSKKELKMHLKRSHQIASLLWFELTTDFTQNNVPSQTKKRASVQKNKPS
jgi:Tfp pilus assembly protein PilN